jgi:alkanesulfonate monooxygenase SsuD/methylene tetrahydromethanopterin reductase-like flavin-dependent oxidoreductase (luciferase family)
VVVLPFDNPLRTAEDYAMVDILSAGRLDLGVGSGYLSHEYAGFGLDAAEKRARFDEALDVLMSSGARGPASGSRTRGRTTA